MKKILFILIFSFIFVSNVNALSLDEQIKSLKENLTMVNERLSNEEKDRLNKMHPIGSIYITTEYSTSIAVSNSIGGTWEAYGTGRTLIGVNTSDSNFNTVNKTGGVSSVALSISNLPSHTHGIPALTGTAASAGTHNHKFLYKNKEYAGWGYSNVAGGYINFYYGNAPISGTASDDSIRTTFSTAGAHTHSVTTNASTTGSNGSGSSFTNLPPYITVYMWKRVS